MAFSEVVRVKRIPNRQDLTPEDQKVLYFSKAELAEIKSKVVALATTKHNDWPAEFVGDADESRDDGPLSMPTTTIKEEYATIIAMEKFRKDQAMKRKQRIDFAVQCVLRQQMTGFDDDELIRCIYGSFTVLSADAAHWRALKLQEELIHICPMASIASQLMERG